MMAASSRRTDGSQLDHEGSQSIHDAIDDEFGSFAAAERLSDPFGDVYGAEADFGDFVGGSGDQEEAASPSVAMENSSLMFFSPLLAPAVTRAPSTLLLTIHGELDPFAAMSDGLEDTVGTGEEKEEKIKDVTRAFEEDLTSRRVAGAPTSTSSATSAILDLVWGNTSQERDGNPLSLSATSVGNGRSRTASNSSGVVPRPSMAATTQETSADLLSFSPVQDSTPIDPFFGVDYTPAPVFDNDELFTVTATPPLSTTSSSARTSLRGSFVSLHDDAKTPGPSSFTSGFVEAKASPHDSFAEPTTRSFRSLSSSFVSAGAIKDIADRDGRHASFSTFSWDTVKATSPSSAPPSLCSSLKMAGGFQGFAPVADESNEADPFAEAGLAAPAEVPLAEALAAWSTDADHVMDEDLRSDCVEKRTDEVNAELAADASKDVVGAASVVEGKNDISNVSDLMKPVEDVDFLDDWMIATEPNEALDDPFISDYQAGDVLHSPATAVDSDVEDDENTVNLFSNDNGNKAHMFGLQGNASDSDISDIDKSDARITANKKTGLPVEQDSVDANNDHFDRSRNDTLSSTNATVDSNIDRASQALFTGALEDQCSSLHQDKFYTLSTFPPSAATGRRVASDELEKNAVGETTKQKGLMQATEANASDNFGDFGGFETAPATPVMKKYTPDASPWGRFPSPTPVPKMPIENLDAVEAFEVSETTSTFADTALVDDGFGDFAQSTEPRGGDEFGDFGDFEPDFQQSRVDAFGESDDGFGDFAPAVAPALVTSLVPSLSKNELSAFFKEAFPMKPLPAILPDQSNSLTDAEGTDSFQVKSTDFIHNLFRDMWNEYIIGTATSPESSDLSGSLSTSTLDTKRASKYLKYVLSEKIQEASKNGIFTHGSERHQMYVGHTASGDADRMCAALKELQDALFHKSVNDAMMRIAKQAALSAKAKIAEQAAQQQANSRGGSLFSTTRHLLSRGGNSLGAHGPSSSGSDSKSDHVGADTPTGVSVQKLARFSFTNNHDDSATAHRGAHNGEERVSDASDHTGHSSGSDTEAASSADSRTRSQISNSGSSNGGLMKKFQNRFSFASSRHRPRFVSLRRKGQSGEEVRKMELNLDAISGGLDEVKWKCALFLYDVEEVTHVAPSQISILAYPSKQPLTGKTDRSALTKLVKSDTIWTVDIGAIKTSGRDKT